MTWLPVSSFAIPLAAGVVASTPMPPPKMKAVPQLDPDAFAGRWYEIARLPTLQQRLTDTRIRLDIERRGRERYHLRRISDEPGGSERVQEAAARRRYAVEEPGQFQRTTAPGWARWLPMTWKDFWVIALDKQYGWAMLGEPRRRELWVLSREPTMERQVLEAVKSTARGLGYDLAPLIVSGQLRSFQVL